MPTTRFAPAQDVEFTSGVDGTRQRYVLMLPSAMPTAGGRVDALIALHGHGADRWQFIRDAREECRGLRDAAAQRGMIVVSPDYRAPTSWMGPAAEADVVQIIVELRARLPVARVFVAGASMGGTSALIFSALHSDLVAGVVCLNGTADLERFAHFAEAIAASYGGTRERIPEEYRRRSPERTPERFTMPVALAVGGTDTVVPPDSVRRLATALRRAGRPLLLIDREARGHDTSYADTVAAIDFVIDAAPQQL